jgi:hypothetical protein
MKKKEAIALMNANQTLLNNIGEIIGTKDIGDEAIWDCTRKPWSYNVSNGQLFIDREDGEGLYGYSAQQISSLGAKGEEFFCGESDGLFYAMAHEEDASWRDTELIILDLDNKVEYDEDERY